MLTIMLTLIPIFGIMLLGAFSEFKRLLPENSALCINQFVYWFSLPSLLFYILSNTSMDEIAFKALALFLISMVLVQIIVILVLHALKVPYSQSITCAMLACCPNTSFIGLPAVSLLYPNSNEAFALAGLIAVIPTLVFIFTDVSLAIHNQKSELDEKSLIKTVKKVAKALYSNPQMIAVFLGICIGPLAFPMHKSILEIARMIGNTAAPCALFCIGITLFRQLKAVRTKTIVEDNSNSYTMLLSASLIAKLALMPLVAFILYSFFNIDEIAFKTSVLMSAIPAATMCGVIAIRHNTIATVGANAILVGTIISVFSLPLIISLIS